MGSLQGEVKQKGGVNSKKWKYLCFRQGCFWFKSYLEEVK